MPNHKELLQFLSSQDRKLTLIYSQMAKELGNILKRYKIHGKSKIWYKNAQVKKEVEAVLRNYKSILFNHISNQVKDAWNMSEAHNDNFVSNYVKGIKLPNEAVYYQRNTKALQAFLKRSSAGFTLSKRVWNLTKQTRSQLEYFLADGLSNGRSAVDLAKDLQRYLKEPEKRFRRVRNKTTGKLEISNPASKFNPGRGVYRSSFKNALRLARNEINIAYRIADHERRIRLPFVIGFEVHLSPAHPKYDICDELAGKYPKGYIYTGWHTSCLCFTTSILMTKEEFKDYLKTGKLNYNNQINTIPKRAERYLNKHSEKIKKYKTKPYFISDNFKNTKEGFALKESVYPSNLNVSKIADTLTKTKVSNSNSGNFFIAFVPFSAIILQKLSKIRKLKEKQKLFEEVAADSSFKTVDLGLKQGGTTKVHPLHKAKGKSWKNTKKMAKDINNVGDDVVFLPEYESETSADALTKIKGKWQIVDFKHSTTTKASTLKIDLAKGFTQAEGVVLKLTKMNRADFIETIDELIRKNKPMGNIKLINKYGKVLDLSEHELKKGMYKKKIKGFF